MVCLATFILLVLWCLQVGEGKSEVDEVVEHFNICAGNPAVCMTQVLLTYVCQCLQHYTLAVCFLPYFLDHAAGVHVREASKPSSTPDQPVLHKGVGLVCLQQQLCFDASLHCYCITTAASLPPEVQMQDLKQILTATLHL